MASLYDIAKKLAADGTPDHYSPETNPLFRCLYDSFCRAVSPGRSFDDLISEASSAEFGHNVYSDACREMFAFYRERCRNVENGGKGIDRHVGYDITFGDPDEKERYSFDLAVRPELFSSYLMGRPNGNEKPLRGSDALSFILHTAVAFLVPAEQLNRVLFECGFHPLHVRNIHHLAIYSVLKDAESLSREERAALDPFGEVRRLYMAARNKEKPEGAGESGPRAGENEAFGSNSTRIVEKYLLSEGISCANMLSFVERHTDFYTMRRRRLLAEHRHLVLLFSELYKFHGAASDESENPDAGFSLYRFIYDFCKKVPKKDFNRQLYTYISKDGRHPTRELMIVLWLYAHCFRFLPTVIAERDFRRVRPFGEEDRPFADFYDRRTGELRVLEYLSDGSSAPLAGGGSGTVFSGDDLIVFLNGKLLSYSWMPLDRRNDFDRTLLGLRPLRVSASEYGGVRAEYGGERIDGDDLGTDNVPAPLAVITQILRALSGPCGKKFPLACSLFELI